MNYSKHKIVGLISTLKFVKTVVHEMKSEPSNYLNKKKEKNGGLKMKTEPSNTIISFSI